MTIEQYEELSKFGEPIAAIRNVLKRSRADKTDIAGEKLVDSKR